jgi:hypothetical protein
MSRQQQSVSSRVATAIEVTARRRTAMCRFAVT